MEERRSVNNYLTSIPVSEFLEAEILGSKNNWDILQALKEAGLKGLTTLQLEEITGIPGATIASALKRLERAELIESLRSHEVHKKWGRRRSDSTYLPKKAGRRPNSHVEGISWGYWYHDDDFYDALEPVLENNVSNMKKIFTDLIRDIVLIFHENNDLSEFLPEDEIHEDCDWSHEAQEFLLGISLGILDEILGSEEYQNLGKRFSYYKD